MYRFNLAAALAAAGATTLTAFVLMSVLWIAGIPVGA